MCFFFLFSQCERLQRCSLWNCPCGSAPGRHSTTDGWMDGWVCGWMDGRGGGGGSVSLGGLAKWAESKWYRSTLADSEAPLIAFDQSGVEGPKPSSLPPPKSTSLSPSAHSIFSLYVFIYLFFTAHNASTTYTKQELDHITSFSEVQTDTRCSHWQLVK